MPQSSWISYDGHGLRYKTYNRIYMGRWIVQNWKLGAILIILWKGKNSKPCFLQNLITYLWNNFAICIECNEDVWKIN